MTKKSFFTILIFFFLLSCGKKQEAGSPDRSSNGGMLRFKLGNKTMHDKYFIALFTPRGNLFKEDNLQLYNYNVGSDKYPQIIININYNSSDLNAWAGKVLPIDFLAFTPAPDQMPLRSKGQVTITQVTDQMIEGRFSGELVNPQKEKSFPIHGEFKAVLQVNS
jgi:hypothetical protein